MGLYTAEIGGLWDALLGEGRRWVAFAKSDFHRHHSVRGTGDFYPGEYQKNYSFAVDLDRNGDFSLSEIAASLRSGNSFLVMGDLIDELELEASYGAEGTTMGGELDLPSRIREPLKVRIRFSSPPVNFNGDTPAVDHIDLVAGDINGLIHPNDPEYSNPTNPTARVLTTTTAEDWSVEEDGARVVELTFEDPRGLAGSGAVGLYLRLRGTNLAPGTPGETDQAGNPFIDSLPPLHLAGDHVAEAWADLWFYSNPIFISLGG